MCAPPADAAAPPLRPAASQVPPLAVGPPGAATSRSGSSSGKGATTVMAVGWQLVDQMGSKDLMRVCGEPAGSRERSGLATRRRIRA
jgi:hypothetical protein